MANPYDTLDHSNDDDLDGSNENDYDEVQQYVDDNIVRKQLPQIRSLDEYFGNERFQVEKGDPKMNLWEQGGRFRKVFLSQPQDVSKSFELLNLVRKAGIKGNWTEKQIAFKDPKSDDPNVLKAACIFIDMDCWQAEKEGKITEKHMYRFNHELQQLFRKSFQLTSNGALISKEVTVYSVITRKPSIKWNDEKKMWKDGYHLYIYARLSRNAKRFFIKEIVRERLLTKSFGKEFQNAEDMLDMQCCHVPTLLFGNCKVDSVPYNLWLVYQWHIEEDGSCIMQKDDHFINSDNKLNFIQELSLNWEGRAIKKLEWEPKDEFHDEVALLDRKAKNTTDEDRQTLLDDLNNLIVNDPEADYLRNVLECLNPKRVNTHGLRFKVIYALVKNNERYIPLAKMWFKKSHKYEDSKFDDILLSVFNSSYPSLTHDTIYHWASKDSPERFKSCNDRSCFVLMNKYVFDSITDGKLGHAHFAELVHMFLKNKYKTDIRGTKKVWLEFKFPTDAHEKGQVYKWCEVTNPDSLNLYLHRKLDGLCKKMVEWLNKKMKIATDKLIEAIAKKNGDATQEKATKNYYTQILKNFKSSARGLWTDGFKAGIMKQSESVFYVPGFLKTMDQGLMDMGVGNGILQFSPLGKLPKLIKSFNNLRVSRCTPTNYVKFNPKDELTRKLLKGLRAMHPDDETDAFEYIQSMMAASLDNRPREAIILMVTGVGSNGKSFRFEMHAAALGEQYCAQMPIAILLQTKEDSGEAPKPFLMKLEAARCAYYEEGPVCAVLYMPIIKRVTGCGNMPGRNLFQEARTIKSRCYHFILSNHDFVVLSHEEAVWRRLRYAWMSMIFKDQLDFDPDNKKHRLMDRSFNAQFIEEDSTKSAYLSIMVFQHMKLMSKHGGIIEHVPHPTIDQQTLDFRNRQDTLNRFITERVLISPGQETRTPLTAVVDAYCDWYKANIKDIKHYKSDIFKQLMDSALKDCIETDECGCKCLKAGYRVMDPDDKRDDDTPFTRVNQRKLVKKEYSCVYPTETPDEYLDRVEQEWEELMAKEGNDKIDLSDTYNYDSDDPDCEEGEIRDFNIKDDDDDQKGEIPIDEIDDIEARAELLDDGGEDDSLTETLKRDLAVEPEPEYDWVGDDDVLDNYLA